MPETPVALRIIKVLPPQADPPVRHSRDWGLPKDEGYSVALQVTRRLTAFEAKALKDRRPDMRAAVNSAQVIISQTTLEAIASSTKDLQDLMVEVEAAGAQKEVDEARRVAALQSSHDAEVERLRVMAEGIQFPQQAADPSYRPPQAE